MSEILQDKPHRKYYLSRKACRGILRRAQERGKELPPQLRTALEAQAGLTPQRNLQIENASNNDGTNLIAFAANQRDEVRDLHDVAGTLCATQSVKQQTFIAEGCLTPWDTQQSRIFTPDGTAPTLAGADGGGGRNPGGLLLTAGFCAGAAPTAGGIGWQEECSPTLKGASSGTNQVPSILCLNDQGGQRMDVTVDQTSTLRAQMSSHQPLIVDTSAADNAVQEQSPTTAPCGGSVVYSGNILQSSFSLSPVAGAQMANQNKCYNNLVMARVFGQQSYAHYAEGVSTLTATGGILGGGGENLVVNEQPLHSQETETYCIVGNVIDRQPQNGGNGLGCQKELAYTLTAMDRHAICTIEAPRIEPYQQTVGTLCRGDEKGVGSQYVSQDKCIVEGPFLIRRLTPTECERLQGFPDDWTYLPGASDSARYKALGNSIAVPCVEHIMQRLVIVTGRHPVAYV